MKKIFLLAALCVITHISYAATNWWGCFGGRFFWLETDMEGNVKKLTTLGPCTGTYINPAWLVTNDTPLPLGTGTNTEWENLLSSVGVASFHSPDGSDYENALVAFVKSNSLKEEGRIYINVDNLSPEMRQYFRSH